MLGWGLTRQMANWAEMDGTQGSDSYLDGAMSTEQGRPGQPPQRGTGPRGGRSNLHKEGQVPGEAGATSTKRDRSQGRPGQPPQRGTGPRGGRDNLHKEGQVPGMR